MTILHPGWASGVLLKSNMSSSTVYSKTCGLRLYFLSKFKNVNVHYFSRGGEYVHGGLRICAA